MAGWGLTQRGGQLARALRELDVRVLDTRMCNNSRFWHGSITPGMLCLEAEVRKQAPCKVRRGGRRGAGARPGSSSPPALGNPRECSVAGTSARILRCRERWRGSPSVTAREPHARR